MLTFDNEFHGLLVKQFIITDIHMTCSKYECETLIMYIYVP